MSEILLIRGPSTAVVYGAVSDYHPEVHVAN